MRKAMRGCEKQALLEVFCACERRFEEKVPVERIECNRWPDEDLDDVCLQKSEA